MHDRNHCCAQMMHTYIHTAYTRRGGAAKIRHAPCSIVPHEFYARLPVTDHRYAPGVTKTKGIHAPRDTPLQLEIQTGAGGEGEKTLPRKDSSSFRFVVSFIFSLFSFLSFFQLFLSLSFTVRFRTIFFSRRGSPSSPRAHATNVTAEGIFSRFGESIKADGICSSSTRLAAPHPGIASWMEKLPRPR